MDDRMDILRTQEHPIEKILLNGRVQRALGFLTRRNDHSGTAFEKLMYSFENPDAPMWDRLRFYPLHSVFEHLLLRHGLDVDMAKFKLFHHKPTLRALVNTARSIRKFGLNTPQKFAMPLMVVWNFTQACNLKCRHCYQDACARPLPDELGLEQKLRLVDELGDEYVPFLALAGGEPLMGKHFWEVLERCREKAVHVTVASNGTLLTEEACRKLVDHGVKYVEVSIDSARPEKHDAFRGIGGSWERSIRGMKIAASTPGLRVGMATCISQMNVDEAEDIIQMAVDIGCSTFVHFNYIPVGRGVKNDINDLDPEKREKLLVSLQKWMERKELGIMSTAPQLGRACYMYSDIDGRMALGHAGSSSGKKTRILAKYIGGCGTARCYCAVQPNGDVTPCVYIPHRLMGSLKTSSLKEIWENSGYLEKFSDRDNLKNHCRVCEYRDLCGGCRARADAYTGDVLAGDPGCVYNQDMWDMVNTGEAPAHGPDTPDAASN